MAKTKFINLERTYNLSKVCTYGDKTINICTKDLPELQDGLYKLKDGYYKPVEEE